MLHELAGAIKTAAVLLRLWRAVRHGGARRPWAGLGAACHIKGGINAWKQAGGSPTR
jgi:hypothetical protein